MQKLGDHVRDLLAERSQTVVKGNRLYYRGEEYIINPFTERVTLEKINSIIKIFERL